MTGAKFNPIKYLAADMIFAYLFLDYTQLALDSNRRDKILVLKIKFLGAIRQSSF